MSPRTCVVIVSHRDVEDTIQCVASLGGSEAPVNVVIVDNHPKDDALQKSLANFNKLEILRPAED
ncbi:MAG: glycosyltransferase family 2 protein, partial [Candidatus Micrarchaeaceae archaeon]